MNFWREIWEGYKKRAWIPAALILGGILYAAIRTLIGSTP